MVWHDVSQPSAPSIGDFQATDLQGVLSPAAQWLEQVGVAEDAWPVDEPQGRATQGDLEQCELLFDEVQTRRLLREAPTALDARMDEILLAALVQALKASGGLDESLIALEGHGREALSEDLDVGRTVGWFTSLFPVRLRSAGSLGQTLLGVRDTVRGLPDKGVGFGLLRYLGTEPVRQRLAGLPEPKVVFNYLGQFDQDLGDGRFAPAKTSAGALIDPATPLNRELEINGQVFAGQLGLTFRFVHRPGTCLVGHALAGKQRQRAGSAGVGHGQSVAGFGLDRCRPPFDRP